MQPRSRRGVFVGFSKVHSSDVPLILNPRTGHISPQYHVVFDDTFSTVPSLSESEEPTQFWNEVDLDGMIHKIPLEDSITYLDDDWLTPTELQEKERYNLRSTEIRQTYSTAKSTNSTTSPITTSLEPNLSMEEGSKLIQDNNSITSKELPTIPFHLINLPLLLILQNLINQLLSLNHLP